MRRVLSFLLLTAAALGGLPSLAAYSTRPQVESAITPPAPGPAAVAPVSGDWLSNVERTLARKEYEASPNSKGLQAPNRAHNLRTYFESRGIRVVDRTAPGQPELVALTTARMGRAGRMEDAAAGEVHSENARVEIRRDGWVEWYENSDRGLEQGFTLETRPAGQGPLVVELAVEGAEVEPAAGGAAFRTASGRHLEYGKLSAFDATGAELAATLEAVEGRVRLVVVDEGAVYPVTIDPLLTSTADTELISHQALAEFGRDVASAGDVNGDGYGDVLVATMLFDAGNTNEGAVFVFHGGPVGIGYHAAPKTTIQPNQDNAIMGFSIAGIGDVNGDGYGDVAVGDYGYVWSATNIGAVFVYHGSATGIIANANPTNAAAALQSNLQGAQFGIAVAGAGDVNGDGYADLIVGSSFYDGKGAAFVFHGSATGIVGTTPATAATSLLCGQAGSEFGWDVAGAGDLNGDGYADVVVGAWRYDAGQTDEGMAFVYLGSASGVASAASEALAASRIEGEAAAANFGKGVAGAGDVNGDGYSDLIVGAPQRGAGEAQEGLAYVIHGSASGIASGNVNFITATWLESNQISAFFGGAVAGAGDINGDGYSDVIVGADRWESGETNEGAAFVFYGSPTGIPTGGPWAVNTYSTTLQVNQTEVRFGLNVASAGDVNGDGYSDVVVGGFHWDGTSGTDEGAAFIYLGGSRGIVNTAHPNAATTIQANQIAVGGTAPWLGTSVAGAGDVNGDGYGDVIVGAPGYDLGQQDEGAAFVYLGGATGVANGNPSNAAATLQSDQVGARLGVSVAGAGDVDADGYADVIAGAQNYLRTGYGVGAAFVFRGSPTGVASGDPSTAATTLLGSGSVSLLGASVASAGDVNADGYADVIVGAPFTGDFGDGAAFVFHGGGSGIPDAETANAATTLSSALAAAQLGASVAGAGDVNGDGYADVIVGAPQYAEGSGETNEGGAFLFLGSASGVPSGDQSTAATKFQANQNGAWLGSCVAAAGDVNRDGYADVIVGAPRYGASDEGAVFLFHGGAGGIANGSPASANATVVTNVPNAFLGTSVASAGDVNADGYPDIIIGGPGFANLGQAWIYKGSSTGLVTASASALLQSNQLAATFGTSVAGAGDVNGDGFADVIVGAPLYDNGETDEGGAFVFLGNGGKTGRRMLPLQTRGDGSGLRVHPWGSAHTTDDFNVGMTAFHPGGRGRVALEVEHCPPGQPFGSGSCTRQTSATWTDVGATGAGVPLTEEIPMASGALRRWRVRALQAPFTVTHAGITPPPKPSHGPWFRLQGQAVEADIRTATQVLAVSHRRGPSGITIDGLVNPTREAIEFTAVLPNGDPARLEIFDIAGRRMMSREIGSASAGSRTVRWSETRNLAAGIYRIRLSQRDRSATAGVVLVR